MAAVVIDIRANQTDFDNKVKNLAKTATAALAAVGSYGCWDGGGCAGSWFGF